MKVVVYGKCLNRSAVDLSDHAKTNFKDFIDYEAKYSVGDYLVHIIQENVDQFIASSSFSGGYIDPVKKCYQKNVSDLMSYKGMPSQDFVFNKIFSILPEGFISPFTDICLIDSGDVIEINSSGVVVSNYLIDGIYQPSPFSTSYSALINTLECYTKNFNEISLMYSGGIDSSLLLLGLEDIGANFDLITFERSQTTDNNLSKSTLIAKKFGYTTRTIDQKVFSEDVNKNHLIELMKKDFINPLNPHYDATEVGDILLSGQNADAVIGLDMVKLNDKASWLRTKARLKHEVLNLWQTDSFLNIKLLNKGLNLFGQDFLNMKYGKDNPYFTFNSNELLSLRTGLDHDSIHNLDSKHKTRLQLESFNHFSYRSWALRMLSHFPNSEGASTHLPYNSAPFISFYNSKTRLLKDSYKPKWRESEVLSKRMGEDYYKVIGSLDNLEKPSDHQAINFSLSGLASDFDKGIASRLLDKYNINNNLYASKIINDVETLLQKIKADQVSTTDISRIYKYINLDYLGS